MTKWNKEEKDVHVNGEFKLGVKHIGHKVTWV